MTPKYVRDGQTITLDDDSLLPKMPCALHLKEQGVVQQLISITERHVDNIQRQVLAGFNSIRFDDFCASSRIYRQSLSFLTTLLSNTEVKLTILKRLLHCLNHYTRLPEFLEFVLSSSKCSADFMAYCGLVPPATGSKSVLKLVPQAFMDELDLLLLKLMELSSSNALREEFVQQGVLQLVLDEMGQLAGVQLESTDLTSSTPISGLAKSVFSSVPWIMARTVDNGDGKFTFTPISNESTHIAPNGAHIHTGFKKAPAPMTVSLSTQTHLDGQGLTFRVVVYSNLIRFSSGVLHMEPKVF